MHAPLINVSPNYNVHLEWWCILVTDLLESQSVPFNTAATGAHTDVIASWNQYNPHERERE